MSLVKSSFPEADLRLWDVHAGGIWSMPSGAHSLTGERSRNGHRESYTWCTCKGVPANPRGSSWRWNGPSQLSRFEWGDGARVLCPLMDQSLSVSWLFTGSITQGKAASCHSGGTQWWAVSSQTPGYREHALQSWRRNLGDTAIKSGTSAKSQDTWQLVWWKSHLTCNGRPPQTRADSEWHSGMIKCYNHTVTASLLMPSVIDLV